MADIAALPLNPSVRNKLQCAGFRNTSDLAGLGPVELSRDAQLSREDAAAVLRLAAPPPAAGGLPAGALSARDLYEKERSSKRIITFCPELDGLLGGGVPTGQVTEFCGVPGVGKTQIGMQLALDTRIPPVFGGPGGEAIYVDTEGSFMLERCCQMADAMLKHLQAVAVKKADPARAAALAALGGREGLLGGIHYFRCRDHLEQHAVFESLPAFLAAHPAVRLLVVDSITFHFRQDYADLSQRTRQLGQVAQQLLQHAGTHDLAVVLMNQVTTRITGADATRLVPALGDSWAHAATNRIILYWKGKQRFAFVFKSPSLPAAEAEYTVTGDGVRSAAVRSRQKRLRPPPA